MEWIEQHSRILVIGCPGSGKTTFIKRLSPTNHPVLNMDDLYWQENWERPQEAEFRNRLKTITNQNRWIIDGNYKRYLDIRLQRAEVVVYLDKSTITCLYRILKRAVHRRFFNSSSLPKAIKHSNQKKRFNWDVGFLLRVIQFNRKDKKEILQLVKDADCKLIILS